MSIRGCIIMSPEDADRFITREYEVDLPIDIMQKYPFIRVQSIKDIHDQVRPQLEYIRRFVNEDRYAYMAELKGLSYIGLNIIKYDDHYNWLKKCDDYKDEIAYINNGGAE